jgi:ABC-type antimicrobial peptide transport system permease subunit
MVLGSAVRLAALGAAIGVPLAVGTGYTLRSTLFGVGPQDPAVLLAATALVVLIGVGAGWLPARRALRIDPATT